MTAPLRPEAVFRADRPSPWVDGLIEQLRALGPAFISRIATSPPASAEIVRGDRYFDQDYLREAILRSGSSLHGRLPTQPESDEQREVKVAAAASRFFRYYSASIAFTGLTALARGVGLDLSASRCEKVVVAGLPRDFVIGDPVDGVVTCTDRVAAWPVDGATVATVDVLREYVWRHLFGDNLAPLAALIMATTRATASVLWSNAAEVVAYIAEEAVDRLGPIDAVPFVEDADALLDAETLPGVPGPNPTRGLIEWVPVDEADFPRGVQLRPHCCITYVLPVRTGLLCGNCPFLPLDDRIALVRERRTGERGGPAELHAIEVGRRKIRTAP